MERTLSITQFFDVSISTHIPKTKEILRIQTGQCGINGKLWEVVSDEYGMEATASYNEDLEPGNMDRLKT
ncbi:hypothetical protein AMTR_s00054p00066380 [Amborella trichopoda]|uniref:Uncharacterized protein n=1 Tax=Amborella trichopoda TaxID=13333 RepID=U5CXT4_AMBTC|nr:hypothetical protein AMTR_s00054p00066380 [Amborella trichopoda]